MIDKIKNLIDDAIFEIKYQYDYKKRKLEHFLNKIKLAIFSYKHFYELRNVDLNASIIFFIYHNLKDTYEFIKENYAEDNFPEEFYPETERILKLLEFYIKEYLENEVPWDSVEKAESYFKTVYPNCYDFDLVENDDKTTKMLIIREKCSDEEKKIKEKMNQWIDVYEKEKFRRKYVLEKEIFDYLAKYGKYLEI